MKKCKCTSVLFCLFAMLMIGSGLKAQEVSVPLSPGWNWISYPNTEVMEVNEALSNFEPAEGDIIKMQSNFSTYHDGNWTGPFTHFIPGMGFKYYSMRVDEDVLVFAMTPDSIVESIEPTNITAESAVVGGTVTLNEGNHAFMRGVCWSTHLNPTVDDDHFSDGSGSGSFSSMIEGLTPQTHYFVRAYVVSDYGLSYGSEMSFTTLQGSGNPLEGAINALYSVSESKQVYFSQGNLQYIGSASTPYWKFADHQWDYLGTTTGQNSSSHNVDRDLFSWGTSGYDHGANCYQPWSTSGNDYDYWAYGNFQYNLNDETGWADWGFNSISNGGNLPNRWHTLTGDEWMYVFNTRTTPSGIRYAKATVNNVMGVILLPDDWCTSYYSLSYTNCSNASFTSNMITASQWNTLEQHGAVFLPIAGFRTGTSVFSVGINGNYWAASSNGLGYACDLYINSGFLYLNNGLRRSGYSVRLVRVAQ